MVSIFYAYNGVDRKTLWFRFIYSKIKISECFVMNKKHQNNNNSDEYSVTGFSELVASPFFYSVLILTVILGLASTFGFFQNPRKLKLIIDLISQRIFISEVEQKYTPKVVNSRAYSVEQEKLQIIYKREGNVTASSLNRDRYSIFTNEYSLKDVGFNPINTAVLVAIDYDISSSQFWENTNFNKSQGVIIGAPISPYYSLEKDVFRYTLRVNSRVL